MPGPAPRRFWTLQLECLVQGRDGVFDPLRVDDAGDAHLRRGDHLDVDAMVRQRAEHGRRHARLPADAAADHGNFCQAVLGQDGAGADLFRDAVEDALRLPADDTVNDMSVTPSWLAVCTITSAAMSASASGAKMAAAMPGRSGTPTTESRATCSSWAIPRTRFRSSMIVASELMIVPGPAWKLDRTCNSIE